MNTGLPDLSVVVVVAGMRERSQRLAEALARQSIASRIEVIFADIAEAQAPDLPVVPGVTTRVVRLPGSCDLGHARAESLRQARAPLVAYLEDHTVPAPGWAAAVVQAMQDSSAVAAAYAFSNGSPDTWWYRSVFMVEYGSMAHPLPQRPIDLMAANNVAYRREPLLALGGRLDELLEQDFFLHKALGPDFQVALAREALLAHQTNALAGELLRGHFEFGRFFAACRVRHERWSRAKRACAAPVVPFLVPLLRLKRVVRGLPGRSLWGAFLAALPAYALVFTCDALGEACGYLAPNQASARSLIWLELEAERARRP
jgi:hypothetical protein